MTSHSIRRTHGYSSALRLLGLAHHHRVDHRAAGPVSDPSFDGQDVYWLESRAEEGGRSVVVRRRPDGSIVNAVPDAANVRTRVHEYGGGAYNVQDGVLIFAHFHDTRLYRVEPDGKTRPITPETALRYADFIFDTPRNRLIAVREDHRGEGEAVNTIAATGLEGDESGGVVLTEGADFYAYPRLSPDGQRLSWIQWNHPNMPWDGSELWVAELAADGTIASQEKVAGGKEESIFQPSWAPDGTLFFVSDRNEWWNFYRWRPGMTGDEQVTDLEAEFGGPLWVFGVSTYGFLDDDTILATYTRDGFWHLATVDMRHGTVTDIASPYTEIGDLFVREGEALFVGGSASIPTTIVRYEHASGAVHRAEALAGYRDRSRLHRRAAAGLLPHRGWSHGARLPLSADEQGLHRARGGTAAAAGAEPRRPDRRHLHGHEPLLAVLDLARLRRAGCQLRRQHRLRPLLPQPAR